MTLFYVLGFALGVFLLTIAFTMMFTEKRYWWVAMLLAVLFSVFIWLLPIRWYNNVWAADEKKPTDYYLPCEVVAHNDGYTIFTTVDQDEQRLISVETGDHDWPDDAPYLLYIDPNGTWETSDDIVMSVWRAS